MAEFDELERVPFLRKYGYWKAKTFYILHNGRYYDSKAIFGVALKYQDGSPLKATEFSGGQATVVPALKALGFTVLADPLTDDLASLSEEVPDSFPEGARRVVSVNSFERSSKTREACIAQHGAKCTICGFEFGAIYGEELEGYIHVHHIVPIASVGATYQIDPKKDLVPVCPNCHAVLHYGGKLRTPEDVRLMRERAEKASDDAA
jgi:5-methylcytosine-specific restriction protein A